MSATEPQASTSGSRPPRAAMSQKPEIEAEISQSDAYLLAMKQIDLKKDMANLGTMPCSRQSLLLGIGGGTAVGMIRFLTSRRPMASSNWAVATFAVLSLTSWEVCRRSLASEQAKMKTVMSEYRQKLKEKEGRAGTAGADAGGKSTSSHIGGVWIGEKGKEMLQQEQSSSLPKANATSGRLV